MWVAFTGCEATSSSRVDINHVCAAIIQSITEPIMNDEQAKALYNTLRELSKPIQKVLDELSNNGYECGISFYCSHGVDIETPGQLGIATRAGRMWSVGLDELRRVVVVEKLME